MDYADSIDQLLHESLAQHELPAVGAALVEVNGRTVARVAGVLKRGTSPQVSLSDKWHIGSCTKSLTAVLWARLVELGLTDWDITLADVFSDLGSVHARWQEFTVRDALLHRAGIGGIDDRSHQAAFEDRRPLTEQRTDAAIGVVSEPPGDRRFEYSNLSYIVVGAAIDRVAAMSYEEAMRVHVLEPMGVDSVGYGAPSRLFGHAQGQALQVDNPALYSSAGTMHITLEDWARLQRIFLVGDRQNLLSEASIDEILRPQLDGINVVIGWVDLSPDREVSYSVQGSNTLWAATASLNIDRTRAAVAVSNDGSEAALSATFDLTREILKLREYPYRYRAWHHLWRLLSSDKRQPAYAFDFRS